MLINVSTNIGSLSQRTHILIMWLEPILEGDPFPARRKLQASSLVQSKRKMSSVRVLYTIPDITVSLTVLHSSWQTEYVLCLGISGSGPIYYLGKIYVFLFLESATGYISVSVTQKP